MAHRPDVCDPSQIFASSVLDCLGVSLDTGTVAEMRGTGDARIVWTAEENPPRMSREDREEWERQDRERMRRYAERQRLVRPSSQLNQVQ